MTIVLIIAIAIIIASYIIGSYFVDYAIVRKDRAPETFNPEEAGGANAAYAENRKRLMAQAEAFRQEARCMEATIISYDGLRLKGWYYPCEGSSRAAILVHGYTGSHDNMLTLAMQYHSWGYSVLLPDNRAHGGSEGKYIGMGWLDRKDLLAWMDWILSMVPDASIVMQGVSMGAAATMMAAGENHPALKAAIEDCGYSSVWDIFSDELKVLFHLPAFPIMHCCSAVMRLKAGYGAREASSVKQLAKTDIPMLFIHGTEDRFVSFRMLDINYQAKSRGYKEKAAFQGARHAESEYTDPEGYYETIKRFLEKQGL